MKRKLILQFFAGVVLLMILFGILGKFFREPVIAFCDWFVSTFGYFGVFLGFFLPDAFPMPFIVHDAFLAAGLLGDLEFWRLSLWAVAGSLSGGTLGFFLARRFSHTTWFRRFMEKKGKVASDLVKRYGLFGLAICATSPVPYFIGVWTVGAFRIPYWKFILVSLIRYPRILFYLYLIKIGVVSFFK